MHLFIDELRQYHADKAQHLSHLERCVREIVADKYPSDGARDLERLFTPFRSPAERVHHHKEELILRELRATGEPIHARVSDIADDHLALDRLVSGLSVQIEGLPDALEIVCADVLHFLRMYDDHANGEESIFFPLSEQILAQRHWANVEKDWEALGAAR